MMRSYCVARSLISWYRLHWATCGSLCIPWSKVITKKVISTFWLNKWVRLIVAPSLSLLGEKLWNLGWSKTPKRVLAWTQSPEIGIQVPRMTGVPLAWAGQVLLFPVHQLCLPFGDSWGPSEGTMMRQDARLWHMRPGPHCCHLFLLVSCDGNRNKT